MSSIQVDRNVNWLEGEEEDEADEEDEEDEEDEKDKAAFALRSDVFSTKAFSIPIEKPPNPENESTTLSCEFLEKGA